MSAPYVHYSPLPFLPFSILSSSVANFVLNKSGTMGFLKKLKTASPEEDASGGILFNDDVALPYTTHSQYHLDSTPSGLPASQGKGGLYHENDLPPLPPGEADPFEDPSINQILDPIMIDTSEPFIYRTSFDQSHPPLQLGAVPISFDYSPSDVSEVPQQPMSFYRQDLVGEDLPQDPLRRAVDNTGRDQLRGGKQVAVEAQLPTYEAETAGHKYAAQEKAARYERAKADVDAYRRGTPPPPPPPPAVIPLPPVDASSSSSPFSTQKTDEEIASLRTRLSHADAHVRQLTATQTTRDLELAATKLSLQNLQRSIATENSFARFDDGGDVGMVVQGVERLNHGIEGLVWEMVEELSFDPTLLKKGNDSEEWKQKEFTPEMEKLLGSSGLHAGEWKELARKARKTRMKMVDFFGVAFVKVFLEGMEKEVFQPFCVGADGLVDQTLLVGIHERIKGTYPQGFSARWRSLTYATITPPRPSLVPLSTSLSTTLLAKCSLIISTLLSLPGSDPLTRWTTQLSKRVLEALDLRLLTQTKFLSAEYEVITGIEEGQRGAAGERERYAACAGLGLRQTRTIEKTSSEGGGFGQVSEILLEPQIVWGERVRERRGSKPGPSLV
ncbi:hypothetical protein P7C70_g4228, partial [Phenoliferia sp. Uapishka_3]